MNDFEITDISPEDAIEVIQWHYKPPYDYYNIRSRDEAMQEFLMGSYYSVRMSGEFVGIFCVGNSAQVPEGKVAGVYRELFVDVGVGMAPSLTGKGKGRDFFQVIVSYLQKQFPNAGVRLSVATFNKRAIKLYTNFGFSEEASFTADGVEFIVMTHSTLTK
ncbi:GNAT family N-acetyltransferase [Alkalicoccobacillus murimartini]|uniref:RimJ/RimL family protein N-acetyltransferase n=1 Tax=Alkalicoccobacillus murimartini TaxID=171685 RepID=A0ABT9YJE1_9BACI|nr:GNAT family protein [Alkalicoccobacillus murimartini]MDQ0207149.1 RimJ/RimL family protein N-acetyltransferase [Alkalicoccobacillus murimartini]